MDPQNAGDAQLIVASYLQALEEHAESNVYPSSVRDLPSPKEAIRTAFKTSTVALVVMGELTSDLRDYLEVAYVSLADYQDEECATLLREYLRASEGLMNVSRSPRERAGTASWQRVSEQSPLAGRIARQISVEADTLRQEFRSWHTVSPTG